MGNPLKFYLGEESHYIIENYDARDSSLFADQYKKALEIIDRYIDAKDIAKEDRQGDLRNNIIAFLGDRGTGKTSCMLSVLNMLAKHSEHREKKKSFAHIDAIDPSFFDANTNILFLVVGKMFSTFKEEIDKNDVRISQCNNETHNLMAAFHKVQSYLSRMHKSPLDDNDTEINQLSNLLVTVDLKKGLEELVDCYLHFFKSDYLVVPVDDIDNNTEHAYVMAEQLRKYLVLPKVIILISFKLEQLTHVIDLYFTKLYAPIIDNPLPKGSIGDMTQKYLLKLFPLTQRVTLPNMNVVMDRELSVYENRKDDSKPVLSGSSIKYTMTSLIFQKTRYLFYHSNGETCPIVPTNLREYRTLLSMLYHMSDYCDEKEEYNKLLFREYFYEEWVDKHLDEKGKTIAQKLIENNEASSFNKLVIGSLSPLISDILEFEELISDKDSEIMDSRMRRSHMIIKQDQYEFQQIVASNNTTYNISIGDVFAVLGEIKNQVVAEKDKMLLFFIESLYSIKLYHYYDEMTESDSSGQCANNRIDGTIKRLDALEGVSNYEKLVGGDFFNPQMLRFLPMENKTNKDRAYRVVNLKPIRILLESLSNGETIDDLSFHTIEFFALTLSRRLRSKNRGDLYPAYRQSQEVYYRSDLNNVYKAIFDLGAFFSNVTNIEYAYNRLHKGLYKIAEDRPNSLLNQLKEKTIEREYAKLYDNSRFLSWCCIRNAVVLQEFGDSFSYIRTGRTRNSDQIRLLQNFFEEVSDFRIKTYDRNINENDAHEIKFNYAEVFTNYFTEIQTDDIIKGLFYNIFDDDSQSLNLDIGTILYRASSNIRKNTLKGRILKNTPGLSNNEEFWVAFNEKITEEKVSKEEARMYLQQLKVDFDL